MKPQHLISEPISLLSPSDGQIRVIRNQAKGTLTLAVKAGGRAHFALELGAKAWHSLHQSTSFPPALQPEAVKPEPFPKPPAPRASSTRARRAGFATSDVLFFLGMVCFGAFAAALGWKWLIGYVGVLLVVCSYVLEQEQEKKKQKAALDAMHERLGKALAEAKRTADAATQEALDRVRTQRSETTTTQPGGKQP